MNNNNNNNDNELKIDLNWDPSFCGSNIKTNSKIVMSVSSSWEDSYAFSYQQFKENTGKYFIELKTINYKSGYEVIGVATREDFEENNQTYSNIYGFGSNGYRCKCAEGNLFIAEKNFSKQENVLLTILELNTNNGKLKFDYYNESGTVSCLSETLSGIKFPCHIACVVHYENSGIEIINIKKIE
eukprot:TRINITY_DN128_c3_g1_i1.p1 TRINITY_DN128_c3_g1~~TRINITY_DN128_c3_g1_i1.p1  ORF type:complete len:185 (-),score=31.47 TRINITY_DN128_c3_g1_i1:86-640(-)